MKHYDTLYKIHTSTGSSAITSYLNLEILAQNMEEAVRKSRTVAQTLLKNYIDLELLSVSER